MVASTTDALLRGRTAELEVAQAALGENSTEIAATLGTVYGNETRLAFLSLWRTYVDLLLDYASGLAEGDRVKQSTVATSLDQSVNDFAALLTKVKLNLAHDSIATLFHMQVKMLKSVMDAQATATPQLSGDQLVAYPALRAAYARTDADAALLAATISAQFPNIFQEDTNSEAANLRSRLNGLLTEHAFLLAKSNVAALEFRNIEYEAAFAALDQNSQELAAVMRITYNDEAATTFLSLWRKHIGLYIDYNLAQVTQNVATKEKIVANLSLAAAELTTLLSSLNPKLNSQVMTALLTTQVEKMVAVIEAATASDLNEFYFQLHRSYEYPQPLADAFAETIIAQFPTRFPADIGSLNRLKNR